MIGRRPPPSALRTLLTSEAGSGVVLIGAAIVALIVANSPLGPVYFKLLEAYVGPLSVLHWINDALMAVFFLLVGLEIKREFLDGELQSWPRRTLPVIAAAGGMIAPALIYTGLNLGDATAMRGWAVSTATDIAFALGVLALLGSRVPVSLKVFLTALAIIDDLGAVVIIAALYTAHIEMTWLVLALATVGALYGLNRFRVAHLSPYLILGALLWIFTMKSGVHATLSGVALATTIPLRRSPGRPDDVGSPLHRLEHALQPWVAYGIVPLFGLANAGVALGGLLLGGAALNVPIGVALGLFLGKQLGVFSFTWGAIRLGFAQCPRDASLSQVYGVCVLCGIGFTMSLFIGLLAFPASPDLQGGVKVGVLLGSVASAALGAAILLRAAPRRS